MAAAHRSDPVDIRSQNKLIKRFRELIPYMSTEASDDSLDLCVRTLDAYANRLLDSNVPWPSELPLSFSQAHDILNKPPMSFGYTIRDNEDMTKLRLRIFRDRLMVEKSQRELLWKFVKTFPNEDAVRFKKAQDFAEMAHRGQFRESGIPYIEHPIKVAEIILDMGMDADAVITGLLHDTVEDNAEITREMIAEEFSDNIAILVDGVTKLTKASFSGKVTKEHQQAENVRKMFLVMAKDIRVIPIKLCDRLHNMRTLEYCGTDKRVRKAQETLEIYAPLAHRLGMGQLKSELEDLSFMHIDPVQYNELQSLVEKQTVKRSEFLSRAMERIREAMDESSITGEVNGRPKHLYSIYRKMQNQNLSFNQVYDLIAVRVIVESVGDCYNVLGMVHSIWRPLPGRIKDYISTPKPNGYRSLHTTLIGEAGTPFEVQIRTEEMHKMAEYGIAAHWKYKEGRTSTNDLDFVLNWVRQLMSEKVEDSDEFMRVLKFDFFSDYVYVFSPEGDIIDLVTGSTPIDFAYRIHSQVGHSCIGAKVNGRIVPLDYQLQMGDIVEIIRSNNPSGPKRDWLNIVQTQQARNKIRSWFKKELKEENIQRGHDMLASEAKKQGYILSQILKEEQVSELFRKLSLNTIDDLYAAVGYGSVTTGQVIPRLIEEQKRVDDEAKQQQILQELAHKQAERHNQKNVGEHGIIVKGESGMLVRIARCCAPVPGDDIVGYITRGRGVSVHRSDCKNLTNLSEGQVRFIDVSWAEDAPRSGKFTATVQVDAFERNGLMMDISQLFMNMNISLLGINAKTDKNCVTHLLLEFEVQDSEHLNHIIKQIRKISSVTDVRRFTT